jgi:hypothetical protein
MATVITTQFINIIPENPKFLNKITMATVITTQFLNIIPENPQFLNKITMATVITTHIHTYNVLFIKGQNPLTVNYQPTNTYCYIDRIVIICLFNDAAVGLDDITWNNRMINE